MNRNQNISRKLPAGIPGTKKMVEKYGEDLICVRYRYDANKKVKYKTVEIIVDSGFWDKKDRVIKKNKIINLKINYSEIELRNKVKAAGGIWDREKKVWIISYKEAKNLGLLDRIIE
jgi:hypothetical protein